MISRIVMLKNVGLFKDATLNGAIDLGKVTVIYGENGRGKSTLSAIIRACSQRDSGRIQARKTIDSQDAPEVSLLVQNGNQSNVIKFENGNWSGTAPSTVIFDSEFVDQNVYSGFEVTTGQRQSLLEFALGEQAVQLKQKVDELTQGIETQTRLKTQAERTLTGFASPYSVADFINLRPVQDIQQQISAIQKRIAATKNALQLMARKDPTKLPLIQIDIASIFNILHKQLPDMEQSAEEMVRKHLEKHNAGGLEDWISRGQDYAHLEQCPFCGQSLTGVDLIRIYRSYFSQAYINLKQEVESIQSGIDTQLADNTINALNSHAATNAACIEAWKDQLDVSAPTLPTQQLLQLIRQLRGKLLALVSAKIHAPLEIIGRQSDATSASSTIQSINKIIGDCNSAAKLMVDKIGAFKKRLTAENPNALQAQLKQLEAAQKRQMPQVIKAVDNYNAAAAERTRLDNEKTLTRRQIDDLMKTLLEQYQKDINDLLASFRAEFSIEQLKPSYVGSGEPRTEYGLTIRKQQVKLGSRADLASEHSFGSTLSEADKRTLAFSFFVARLRNEPNLVNYVVVLDDPVSSLDRNRRYESLRIIAELAPKCHQLIVLSHDPYFLRDLKERLDSIKPVPIPAAFKAIKRVENGYSAFDILDIERECSSDYYRYHRLVTDFVEGRYSGEKRNVAEALRPLLEGYYHRRFPGRIPRRVMFGQLISLAQQATPPDPLANLVPILNELSEVNDYIGRFHHDAKPDDGLAQIVDAELLYFAERVLNLIYKNG